MSAADLAAERPVAPRVSVVIPSYRAAAFIAEAVASARAQTLAPAEILVVDDASPDETAEVAERLGVTVLRQPENRGPSAARNAGVARAAGDLVAFLDADDAWLPWHLELCADALARHPGAALACTGNVLFDAPLPARPAAPRVELPADPVVTLIERSFIPQTGAVVRRAALLAAGGYDETMRYAEDYDLWLRIAAAADVARVHAPGSRHRRHPGQATTATRRMVEGGFAARRRALAAVRATGDAARAARAEAAISVALDAELHAMWYVRDAAAFADALAIAGEFPGAAAVRARWAMRRRVGWHLYHALRAVKHRIRAR